MPPPESIPAHSDGAGLPWKGGTESAWSTASHSARASCSPLSMLKLARSPNISRRRSLKFRRCPSASTPMFTAWRTPAVAPTRTRPFGNLSARSSSSAVARVWSCSAFASGSPRQFDFSCEMVREPGTRPDSSVKAMPRVEPLPQSTTEMWRSGSPRTGGTRTLWLQPVGTFRLQPAGSNASGGTVRTLCSFGLSNVEACEFA
mmetsp:Transcript_69804/g.161485  ORF Transcript_69804/g.161485 Transcript_69804/m.161485 type:complete len:203 (-) Transcript_69804:135-743(-)